MDNIIPFPAQNEEPEEEEESSILELTDDEGNTHVFEYLDSVTYEDIEYLILIPEDEPETNIVVVEVQPVDEENETYMAVDDERILDAVWEIFKERYRGILTFED